MKELLFTPYKINDMEIKNRIIMLAMHLGYADKNEVSQKDLAFYKARAKGGAGAITIVTAINDIAGHDDMHRVSHDQYILGLEKLVETIHPFGCKLIAQLFHGGRNITSADTGGKQAIAPSPIPSPIYREIPREMTLDDINSTVEDFGKAALRCKKSGIDGVEISCSAGYLLSQFLSPLTNQRNDEYGGSKENRMRFPREVIRKVREYVGPSYPVILRISATDMLPGGYGIEYMQEFCATLDVGLIDAINVTGGWHESPVPQISAHVPEGGYAFLAGAIKRVVDIPVIASNRINNGKVAEEILQSGLADFVGIGRAFLAEAEFANKIKAGELINRCQACNKGCIERVLRGKDVCCVFNSETGNEYLGNVTTPNSKKVLIIGAGPAGMEAAKTAAKLGHDVILCTKDGKMGGLLTVALKPPHKKDIEKYIIAMEKELEGLNIELRFNTIVDTALIERINPDHIIMATGSMPIVPNIPGLKESRIYLAEDVLKGDKDILNQLRRGRTVIIGGGAVGLETAHYLAESAFSTDASIDFLNKFVSPELTKNLYASLDITVVEMEKKVGKGVGGTIRTLLAELKWHGVKIVTSTKVLSVVNNNLILGTEQGETASPVDNIILAIGYRPTGDDIIAYLEQSKYSYSVVGDAKKPRDVMAAQQDARQAAFAI